MTLDSAQKLDFPILYWSVVTDANMGKNTLHLDNLHLKHYTQYYANYKNQTETVQLTNTYKFQWLHTQHEQNLYKQPFPVLLLPL